RSHTMLHSFPTRRSSDLPSFIFWNIPLSPLRLHLFFLTCDGNQVFRTCSTSEAVSSKTPTIRPWSSRSPFTSFTPAANALYNKRSEEHTSELQSRENLVC